jgi:hypothetical protein
MAQEHHGEHPSLRAAIDSIAPQTLYEWIRKQEVGIPDDRDRSFRGIVTDFQACPESPVTIAAR